MILLNPKQHQRSYPDARSAEVMRATIGFFESKGKEQTAPLSPSSPGPPPG